MSLRSDRITSAPGPGWIQPRIGFYLGKTEFIIQASIDSSGYVKVPSKENIDVAKQIRNEFLRWKRIDELIYNEFKRFNKNVNKEDVAYKVKLLKDLYGCKLADNSEAAELIINAEIDDELHDGNPVDLVEKIEKLSIPKVGNERRSNIGVVFSSKYCHFHESNRFAIYDQYAKRGLEDLLERKIKERTGEDYSYR